MFTLDKRALDLSDRLLTDDRDLKKFKKATSEDVFAVIVSESILNVYPIHEENNESYENATLL